MKAILTLFGLLTFTVGSLQSLVAHDATTVLLQQLDKGGCVPSSLTGRAWTIRNTPTGNHGELNYGDVIELEEISKASNFNLQGEFTAWKNGEMWPSANGWNGSCIRDGDISIYVIIGTFQVDGCTHELALGRLDHDDDLTDRIEVIFEHADTEVACGEHSFENFEHTGHTHGGDDHG